MDSTNILSILEGEPKGISFEKIAVKLGIDKKNKKERKKLKKILKRLTATKKIVKKNKKYYSVKFGKNSYIGEFIAVRGGYGFVSTAEFKEDIFIPPGKTLSAMDGDEVEVEIVKSRKKKGIEGKIIKIINRKRNKLIGFFDIYDNSPYFIPLDIKFQERIPLLKLNTPVLPGMLIEVEYNEDKTHEIVAKKIKRIIGHPDKEGVDLKAIIIKYGIREKFGKKIRDELKKASFDFEKELKRRVDLRKKTIFTIDGEDAKDFDDAVSIEKKGNYYILGVHIADVSYFVKPETSLDKEALKRGNSVYFPERAIPMLPEKLSNDLCSLKEGVPRLTFTVEIKISKKGEVKGKNFYLSVIESKKRLTYNQVQRFFEGDKKAIEDENVKKSLLLMKELAEILIKVREEKASIDFDMPEPYLLYEGNTLSGVIPEERFFSHRLIEEFMLCANEAVAEFIAEKEVNSIYRIHEEPDPIKLLKLKEILFNFGYEFDTSIEDPSIEMQRIIKEAKGKDEEKFINILILRSMKLAKYSPYNYGHFALKKQFYTHFTSPIRRYPDLVVHRILKAILGIEEGKFYELEELERISKHTSETERRADEAEYELVKWRIVRFLKNKLGENFYARITGFTQTSIILELEDYFVEGILPYSMLMDDYYYLKEDKVYLKGKRKGKEFKLGDKVEVTLMTIDEIKQKLIFTIKI